MIDILHYDNICISEENKISPILGKCLPNNIKNNTASFEGLCKSHSEKFRHETQPLIYPCFNLHTQISWSKTRPYSHNP